MKTDETFRYRDGDLISLGSVGNLRERMSARDAGIAAPGMDSLYTGAAAALAANPDADCIELGTGLYARRTAERGVSASTRPPQRAARCQALTHSTLLVLPPNMD